MQVICKDNYDRELFDDEVIIENVTQEQGELICKELNKLNRNDTFYYRCVDNNYKLFVREY